MVLTIVVLFLIVVTTIAAIVAIGIITSSYQSSVEIGLNPAYDPANILAKPVSSVTVQQESGSVCCQSVDRPDVFFKDCKKTCASYGSMTCTGLGNATCLANHTSCDWTNDGCVSKANAPNSYMQVDMSVCNSSPAYTRNC